MPKLTDFQSLLFDVDMTLTNSHREVTPELHSQLQRLADRGYLLGVCTSRSFPSLSTYILDFFPQNAVHILCNGAQVVDAQGKILFEKNLSDAVVQSMLKSFDSTEHEVIINKIDSLYATPNSVEKIHQHPWHIPVLPLSDLNDFSTPLLTIYNLNDKEKEMLTSMLEMHATFGQSSYTNKVLADITSAGVDKASGLDQWSAITGVSLDQVIAFGDGTNDLPFFDKINMSIAMGNAIDQIKNKAHRIIGDTNENGLAIYLEAALEGADL